MSCFGNLSLPEENYVSVLNKLIECDGEIDRPTRNRRKTDKKFIYFMAFFFAILASLIIYCGVIGSGKPDNPRRHRRDISTLDGPDGMDMNTNPFQDLAKETAEVVALIIALIIATILVLRYFIGAFIWMLLVLGSLAAIIISAALWITFFQIKDKTHGLIILPLGASAVTFVLIFLIYATRKRIQMIIQIFKEASIAIGDMPQLFIQPAISFTAFLLSGAMFCFLLGVVVRAGAVSTGGPDDLVITTGVLLYWGGIWLVYFYKGCQSMVIGGTVATWYFRRDKTRLGAPMWTTTKNVVLYHLGTVAFGSFLMLLMQIVKSTSDFFTKNKVGRTCCCCCSCICCLLKNVVKYLEGFIKYFTKMSYIMTAIHGVPFCVGCREAIILLLEHALSLLQLKCFCKFVMFLLQLIIVAVVVFLSRLLTEGQYRDTMSIFAGIFAFFAANTFLGVYNITIDTIFLCYCEDLAENDGVQKPYFMSRDLMRFMEDSKKTLADILRDATGVDQQ